MHSSIWCTRNSTAVDKEGAWGEPHAAQMTRQEDTVCWQQYWYIPWHGNNEMKWGGLRVTQKKHQHLPEQPDSCIINSHSTVPSVSNPAGISGITQRQLHCTAVPKMFSLCFIYMIAHCHLCKALHSFSAHDNQPSMNKPVDCTWYSTVTGDCLMLLFLWKMHSNTFSFMS